VKIVLSKASFFRLIDTSISSPGSSGDPS